MTNNNIIYNISFDVSLYSNYLDSYPCLLQNGYGLGFFPDNIEAKSKKKFDPLVSSTIESITVDFISSFGHDVFILYHCESNDGKQASRAKLFEKWYSNSAYIDKMFKHGLEVEIMTKDDGPIYHYIGFITQQTNKNIGNAIIELESFSVDLVNVNKNTAN